MIQLPTRETAKNGDLFLQSQSWAEELEARKTSKFLKNCWLASLAKLMNFGYTKTSCLKK